MFGLRLACRSALFLLPVHLAIAPASPAAVTIPGSDGSDSVLRVEESTVIDLRNAVEGDWDAPSPTPGNGVYDPSKWAVVFKYSAVDVQAGATLSFVNHPKNPPVVWLVEGDVTINGHVDLAGEDFVHSLYGDLPAPGPGGFSGGLPRIDEVAPSAGFGPGGGFAVVTESLFGSPGSYGSRGSPTPDGILESGPVYGNPEILPLIGGSGGGGSADGAVSRADTGGAGGGAILIVARSIVVNGRIDASGGDSAHRSGSGSGGAIRLVADSIAVSAPDALMVDGGSGTDFGGRGRIRLEAHSFAVAFGHSTMTQAPPSDPVTLWADRTVTGVTLSGEAIPADPEADLDPLAADVILNEPGERQLVIETRGVPTDATVMARLIPVHGADHLVVACVVAGDLEEATWHAAVDLDQGVSVIQVMVNDQPLP